MTTLATMLRRDMLVDFEPATCLGRRCSVMAVRRAAEGFSFHEEKSRGTSLVPASKWVGTLSTPWASDSVIPASDRTGLGMFRKRGGFSGGAAGSSPPRAQCFGKSERFGGLECAQNSISVHTRPNLGAQKRQTDRRHSRSSGATLKLENKRESPS